MAFLAAPPIPVMAEGLRPEGASPLERELLTLHPKSFGWAVACCRYDRAEAEEVLQASYLKVLSGAARFDGKSGLKTWLFGVIRRTAAESRRRSWLRSAFLGRMVRQGTIPDPAPPQTLRHLALRSLLRRLSRRQREVLELVFYQDLSIEEAAVVMAVSPGSARVHYERGKKNLRRGLAVAAALMAAAASVVTAVSFHFWQPAPRPEPVALAFAAATPQAPLDFLLQLPDRAPVDPLASLRIPISSRSDPNRRR
jgi:RNA polymerase sigma factor (sigma-70 family)